MATHTRKGARSHAAGVREPAPRGVGRSPPQRGAPAEGASGARPHRHSMREEGLTPTRGAGLSSAARKRLSDAILREALEEEPREEEPESAAAAWPESPVDEDWPMEQHPIGSH